jgi:hypothetical protein
VSSEARQSVPPWRTMGPKVRAGSDFRAGGARGACLHLENDDAGHYLFDSVSTLLSSLSRIALLLYLIGTAALQPNTAAERHSPFREPEAALADARDHLAPARSAEALDAVRALSRATTSPDARRNTGGEPDRSRAALLARSAGCAPRPLADADAARPRPVGNRPPYDATAPPILS